MQGTEWPAVAQGKADHVRINLMKSKSGLEATWVMCNIAFLRSYIKYKRIEIYLLLFNQLHKPDTERRVLPRAPAQLGALLPLLLLNQLRKQPLTCKPCCLQLCLGTYKGWFQDSKQEYS